MKYNFKNVLDLSEFLQSNTDKKYKIKTKFSYKKDEINVEKYEVTEIKDKELEKKTYLVSRMPTVLGPIYSYSVEELAKPTIRSAYILNVVKPCGSFHGLGHDVIVVAIDESEARTIGERLIEDYIISVDETYNDVVTNEEKLKTYHVYCTKHRPGLKPGESVYVAEELPELIGVCQSDFVLDFTEPIFGGYSVNVKAIDKEDAILIGRKHINQYISNYKKKIFKVWKQNNTCFAEEIELELEHQYLLKKVWVSEPPSPIIIHTYVEAFTKEEALKVGYDILYKFTYCPDNVDISKTYSSLEDFEEGFKMLKRKSSKSLGLDKKYWTRLFNGKDILKLVRSFYDSSWGYKQKVDSIKDLKDIKVSGMFLTDKFLTVTILAEIDKG